MDAMLNAYIGIVCDPCVGLFLAHAHVRCYHVVSGDVTCVPHMCIASECTIPDTDGDCV